jgi:hypothetical protein
MSKYNKYLENMERLADDAFKDHRVRYAKEDRWTIQRHNDEKHHWEGFYWTEIVTVADGILVHGDIDTCLFKFYKGDKKPFGPIHWVAHSGVDYLEEKCSIGMDDKDVCRTFDDDVALWEIEGLIRDVVHDICYDAGYETPPDVKVVNGKLCFKIDKSLRDWEPEGNEDSELEKSIRQDDVIAAWMRAHGRIGGDHWELIRNDLYEDLIEAGESDAGELVYGVGVVPAPRLFYARAACRKLIELLEQDKPTEES